MASTAHGTLTPDVVSYVTVNTGRHGVVVLNRSMVGAIWVRLDGQDPTPAQPGTYVVLGARDFPIRSRGIHDATTTVAMLSSDALDYTVEAI